MTAFIRVLLWLIAGRSGESGPSTREARIDFRVVRLMCMFSESIGSILRTLEAMMRFLEGLVCLGLLLLTSGAAWRPIPSDCDVASVLSEINAPPGTIALTTLGEAEEVEAVYVPTTIKTGLYKVTVTRKGDDLYTIDGSKLALRTQVCMEYGYSEDAFLDVRSSAGVTVGTLTFKEP